jgi:peroxiredoxin family protein
MQSKNVTIVVHSGDFDKIMSAFIIGNGFLSMGFPVTLFFTFWGLLALKVKGFKKAPLSRMNMLGLGRFMIKKKVLDELASNFIKLEGKIIACTMTMELMGVKEEDLRTDLVTEFATVGKYCYATKDADIALFI